MSKLPLFAWLGCALAAQAQPSSAAIEENGLRQLLSIRRVYVDHLTGGETAAQMRDILISALAEAKLFILTENQERADVILHGASEDLVYTDTHQTSDGINAHLNGATGRSASSSYYSHSNNTASAGLSVGENESEHDTERRHEAVAAVRLVNKDGDVIWSTTQESLGAKYHGASADVADKIAAKLKDDFDKARKLPH
ncbi:MAG TPA: hypothetical protein VME43_33380 [Bryobacteraceae bacterium]|nr:hypothetical protein [Bryobacteraceae bacterium]